MSTTAVATSRGEARHAANECDIKVFCCPKLGNSLEEYEDAWAHRQSRTPVGIRVAVADGATESSFAKLWPCCWPRAMCEVSSRGRSFLRGCSRRAASGGED